MIKLRPNKSAFAKKISKLNESIKLSTDHQINNNNFTNLKDGINKLLKNHINNLKKEL